MAQTPTLKVYVAYADGPLVVSPTWTDESAYVRAFSTDRDLGEDLRPSNPGSASVTFDNRTRRFDPVYAAGPHFGNLLPRKQVKIEAVWNAVTYPVFRGWVAAWPQAYPASGADATVTVECFDALGMLGTMNLPEDVMPEVVADIGNPTHWWRLGDAGTPAVGGHRAGICSDYLNPTEDPLWAALTLTSGSSLGSGLRGNSTTFNGQQYLVNFRPDGVPSVDGQGKDITVSCWITTSKVAASGVIDVFFGWWFQTDLNSHYIAVNDTGYIEVHWTGTNSDTYAFTASVTDTSSVQVNDGLPHHVAVVLTGTGNSVIYVDGVDVTVAGIGTAGVGFGYGLGNLYVGRGAYSGWVFNGSIQEVQLWLGTALTAVEVEDLCNAGRGRIVESTEDRAIRLLDAVGWPSGLRDITTDPAGECGSITYSQNQVTSELQKVEATEQGLLFAARDGKITLTDRWYTVNSTEGGTSQATFSDDGAAIGYTNLAFRWDADQMANDMTVVIEDATQQRSYDQTSIDDIGRRSDRADTVLSESTAGYDMAHGLVAQYKDPQLRAEPFAVVPAANPSVWWPLILDLELGYRITLERTPMGVGSQIQQACTLQGIRWDATPEDWRVTLRGSARPTFDWFVLDTSELDAGHLGY